jgi:hypothetical protein
MRGPDGVLVRALLGDAEVRIADGLRLRPFIIRYPPSPGVVGPEGER